MNLDITIHRGETHRPVVIFIHGLGMDKTFWIDPLRARVFGRVLSMSALAARKPRPRTLSGSLAAPVRGVTIGSVPARKETLWRLLAGRGFTLICWSQKRPVGPMHVAVRELAQIMRLTGREFPRRPVALLCHSRGGLIARKFMEQEHRDLKALITIATPHRGSSLSRLGSAIAPLGPFLKKIIPRSAHGTVTDMVQRFHDLLQGDALRELMPDSDFFHGLRDVRQKGVRYLSFGGSRPEILTLYRWVRREDRVVAVPLVTIPDSLLKVLPGSVVPEEIIPGKGDFLVSTKSAVMPWGSEHLTVRTNHVALSWNSSVMKTVAGMLDAL